VNRKRLLLFPFVFVAFLLWGCETPRLDLSGAAATPIPVITLQAEETPLLPTAELGRAENPIILALPPSAGATPEQVNAAREIAAQFTKRTGYVVVVVAPDSYAALVNAFEKGNAHIALLDPLAYALAHQRDLVRARFAIVREGKIAYGTQFLARSRDGFVPYFDPPTGENTADAFTALAQFNGKKPCWSEETSPSGHIIPLGLLNQARIQTQTAAFAGSQTTVVRSLYKGGICDFGATYVDARKFPSLEDEMPDLLEQVHVIWRTPDLIPYEVLVFSTHLPEPMRDVFSNLIPAILQTDAGKAAFQTAYDIDEIRAANDGDFSEFRALVQNAGLDVSALLNGR